MRSLLSVIIGIAGTLILLTIVHLYSIESVHKCKNFNIYDAITIKELITKGPLAQNDFRIVEYIIENKYVEPPPLPHTPYNLTKPLEDPSMGQSEIVQKIFQGKTDGFFVECGALDGETRSNTLALERDFGWKGLLIEGDPLNYELMRMKRRRAATAGCCLAIHPYPHEVVFKQKFNLGKIVERKTKNIEKATTVQCFPLYSILSALGVKTVDYLSLDVEGFELDVLRTIPFDSVYIKVLTVEFTHGKGGTTPLIAFMESKGYRVATILTHVRSLANDVVFVHKDFPLALKFPTVIPSEDRKKYLDKI